MQNCNVACLESWLVHSPTPHTVSSEAVYRELAQPATAGAAERTSTHDGISQIYGSMYIYFTGTFPRVYGDVSMYTSYVPIHSYLSLSLSIYIYICMYTGIYIYVYIHILLRTLL